MHICIHIHTHTHIYTYAYNRLHNSIRMLAVATTQTYTHTHIVGTFYTVLPVAHSISADKARGRPQAPHPRSTFPSGSNTYEYEYMYTHAHVCKHYRMYVSIEVLAAGQTQTPMRSFSTGAAKIQQHPDSMYVCMYLCMYLCMYV